MLNSSQVHPFHSFACGEVDVIEYLNAPRKALRARATDALLPESIESEIPQFKTTPIFALAKGIKFRMHLIKEISVLLGNWVGLHMIGANGKHLATMENNAAMPLRAVDA